MKRTLSALILSTISTIAFATCQLGERCDYFNNDITIAPPYIGTYQCILDPSNIENITLEVRLLTANTIAEPAPLILTSDNRIGVVKVISDSGQTKYLANAFVAKQTTVSFCDETSGKDCDLKPNIMCERISD